MAAWVTPSRLTAELDSGRRWQLVNGRVAASVRSASWRTQCRDSLDKAVAFQLTQYIPHFLRWLSP